jgi:Flp pilus assembly protein TadD
MAPTLPNILTRSFLHRGVALAAGAARAVVAATLLLASATVVPAWAQSAALIPEPQSEAAEIAKMIRAGKENDALERAETTLKSQPRNVQVRFMRAVLLVDLGRRPEAISEYEKMTQEYPELPEPYNNLAVLLAADGKLTQAEALLQRALVAQPGYGTAYENLGDVYLARAVDAYRRALANDAGNAPLQAKLAAARDLTSKLAPSK